jgi:hypothetical protein
MMEKKYEPVYLCWVETDFMGDRTVMRMTPHQRLMYRALCQAAMFCSSRPWLPDDDNELYLLADADSLEHWKANRDVVLTKFYPDLVDGKPMLAHKRILHDWDKLMAYNEQQRDRIKRRWAKKSPDTDCIPPVSAGIPPEYKLKESKLNRNEIESKEEPLPPDGGPDLSSPLGEVWNYYLTMTNRSPKMNTFTVIRKRKGLARLKECLTKTGGNIENAVKLMKIAIDKIAASDFHMGRDQKTDGKKYNDWENNVFRSLEQMEGWWQK